MSYQNFVQLQESSAMQLREIVKLLKTLAGRKIITFSHDDPDGITSAAIFKRLTDKLGIKNKIYLPGQFVLSKKELKDALDKDSSIEAVFVLDKGTIEGYNSYIDIVKNFVVIDHHPPIGKNFSNILVFNPSVKEYTQCSCSLLLNVLYNLFYNSDREIDLITLIGLKADWGIDTLNNIIPPFVRPFYEEKIISAFSFLLEPRRNLEPTIFEISNREITNLLNHLAQLFFAVSGGGFQYFYNEYDEKLKDVFQPELCLEILLEKLETNKFDSIDDFIKNLKEKEKVRLIYSYFLKDIENTSKLFDTNTFIGKTVNGVDVYLFFGKGVRLMPMVGSVKLYEYAKGKESAIIMVNRELNGGTHLSFRANTDIIHLGKLANDIAKSLVEKYGFASEISGGGHPRAAEMKAQNGVVSFVDVMKIFFDFLSEIVNVK